MRRAARAVNPGAATPGPIDADDMSAEVKAMNYPQ
jgi:hypothetical protein